MPKAFVDETVEVESTEGTRLVAAHTPAGRKTFVIQRARTGPAEVDRQRHFCRQVPRHQRRSDACMRQAYPGHCIDAGLVAAPYLAARHMTRETQSVPNKAAAGLQVHTVEAANHDNTYQL